MSVKEPRVLYVTYDGLCDPLGQSQVLPYLKNLAVAGNKIYILSFEKKRFFNNSEIIKNIRLDLSSCGITWECLCYHNAPRLIATFFDVFRGVLAGIKVAKKNGLSIIHARGYIPAFIACWIRKFHTSKFIFDTRGFWVDEKADAGFWKVGSLGYRVAKCIEKSMFEQADRIVVLTKSAEKVLAERCSDLAGRIEIIPTCVDLDRFKFYDKKEKKSYSDALTLLYSGSVGTFYGFDAAVRFFSILLEKRKDASLLLLINNANQEAEKLLTVQNISRPSYKIMTLPYSQVPSWVCQADFSLIFYRRLNSFAGCCPTRLAESLACGVPVIMNKGIGDCDNIVLKKRVGFIVDDLSEKALRKACGEMLDALDDNQFDMRFNCRNLAENTFSLDGGVRKYSGLYGELS